MRRLFPLKFLTCRFPGAGLFALLAAVSLSACGTAPHKEEPAALRLPPPSHVTRAEVMAIADRYASHEWVGTRANVRHGPDAQGIRIDTPDISFQKVGSMPGFWIPGEKTEGIPYQWGGFCTPAEFDRGVSLGLAAGDIYTLQKRKLLDDAVSAGAVGIDCSGYVSRCWKLPRSFSTRELASLCDPLPAWEDLRPGDVLNTWNSHVVIFSGWEGPGRQALIVYETGGHPVWKAVQHSIPRAYLEKKGFRPLRYRGIRDA